MVLYSRHRASASSGEILFAGAARCGLHGDGTAPRGRAVDGMRRIGSSPDCPHHPSGVIRASRSSEYAQASTSATATHSSSGISSPSVELGQRGRRAPGRGGRGRPASRARARIRSATCPRPVATTCGAPVARVAQRGRDRLRGSGIEVQARGGATTCTVAARPVRVARLRAQPLRARRRRASNARPARHRRRRRPRPRWRGRCAGRGARAAADSKASATLALAAPAAGRRGAAARSTVDARAASGGATSADGGVTGRGALRRPCAARPAPAVTSSHAELAAWRPPRRRRAAARSSGIAGEHEHAVRPRRARRRAPSTDAPGRSDEVGQLRCAAAASATDDDRIQSRLKDDGRRPITRTRWTVVSTSPRRACSPSRSARTRSPTTWPTRRRPATRPTAPPRTASASCCSPNSAHRRRPSAARAPAVPDRRGRRPTSPPGRRARPASRSTSPSSARASSPSRPTQGTRYTRNGQFTADAAGHARRPRRATPCSAADGRPCSVGADGTVDPRRARRRRRSRNAAQGRATRSSPARPAAPPAGQVRAGALEGSGADAGPLDGRHDRLAARLRGRPEGHPTIDETLGKAASQVGSSASPAAHAGQPARPPSPTAERSLAGWTASGSRGSSLARETRACEGLNTAAAGMAAQQQRLDAVANDLANVEHDRLQARPRRLPRPRLPAGRPRRRRRRAHRRRRRAPSTPAARSARARSSARTRRSTSRSRARASSASSSPTAAPALTRDGDLQVDGQRPPRHLLRRARSQPAITAPRRAPPEADIAIGRDGTVTADGRRLGTLDARRPSAPRRPARRPATTPSSPPPPPARAVAAPRATTVAQGALEVSNVDMSDAMVDDDRRPSARYELASQGDPDRRPDVGDRQRGQAMSGIDALPLVPASGAARRRARRLGRRHSRTPTAPRSASSRCSLGQLVKDDGQGRRPARRGRLRRLAIQDAFTAGADRGRRARARRAPLPQHSIPPARSGRRQGAAHDASMPRSRAARAPRRAARAPRAGCSRSSSTRARRSAPATSTPSSASSPTSRPRWAAAARSSRSAPACSQRAGAALGVPATEVTLERALPRWSRPAPPTRRAQRSAELRGLLAEIAREHGINRALMRQELAFLVPPDPADRRRDRAAATRPPAADAGTATALRRRRPRTCRA